MTSKLNKILAGIPLVEIDGVGTFEYILLRLSVQHGGQPTSDNERILVRGYMSCNIHSSIFERVHKKLTKKFGKRISFDLECLGGGRIAHRPKTIIVCGTSQRYGPADHEVTTNLLKARYQSEGCEIVFSYSIPDTSAIVKNIGNLYYTEVVAL